MIKIRLPVKKVGEKKKKIKRDGGFILDEDGYVPLCKENVIAILAYFIFNEPIKEYLECCHNEDIDININEEEQIAVVHVPYDYYKEAYFDPLSGYLLLSYHGPYGGYNFNLEDKFDGEIIVKWKFNSADIDSIVNKEKRRDSYEVRIYRGNKRVQ